MLHKYQSLLPPSKAILTYIFHYSGFLSHRTTPFYYISRLIQFVNLDSKKCFDAKNEFGNSNPFREQVVRCFSVRSPFPSSLYCSGCGSKFQSQNSEYPGFVSEKIFSNLEKKSSHSQICQRCDLLNKNVSPDFAISQRQFATQLMSLNLSHSIVLLVVDMFTFPIGVYRHWNKIIPPQTPVILLLNKVDLIHRKIVGSEANWEARYKKSVLSYLLKETLSGRLIVDAESVSGLSGIGMDRIAQLLLKTYAGLDVYLFGSTNSGKSTIYNFLQNKLWFMNPLNSPQSQEHLENSTVSKLPGTTQARVAVPIPISKDQKEIKEAKILHREGLTEEFENPFTKDNIKELSLIRGKLSDTPGLDEEKQLISFLTLEELEIVHPKDFVTSRMYALEAGDSLLIAALARVDLLHQTNSTSVKVKMFFPNNIPLFNLETSKVGQYLEQFRHSRLKLPIKTKFRKIPYPQLIGKEITVDAANLPLRSIDILISNLGWLNVNITNDQVCTFKIYTPKGRGIMTREPIFTSFTRKF